MKRIEGNRLLSLHAVQRYLADNAATLGQAVPAEIRTMLDDCLAALKDAAERQNAHTRLAAGAVARQRLLRRALIRDHMTLISSIATLRMEQEPALVTLATLGRRLPAEQLAAHARGMAQTADRWADLFVRNGCRPTFSRDLNAAVDAFLGTLQDRARHLAEVRAATVALRTGLARARKVVQAVDGFLRSALAGDPVRLAGWTLVKRVPRVPRRAQASDVAEQDAATAADTVEVLDVGAEPNVGTAVDVERAAPVETALDVNTAVKEPTAPSQASSLASSLVSRLVPAWFGSRLSPLALLVPASLSTAGASRRTAPPIDASRHSRLAYKSVPCRLDRGDPRM